MATTSAPDPSDLSALSGLAPELATAFVSLSSDIALVIGRDGIVTNVATADSTLGLGASHWVGRPWADTATGDTRRKIELLLAEVGSHGVARRREVNHACGNGEFIPISYAALRLGAEGPLLAVGRDLRAVAAIQQRFVEAQREMERDYWQLRQAQSRQRLLAQVATDAVLVVQGPALRAIAANEAARRWFGEPGMPLPAPLHDLLALAPGHRHATEVRLRLPQAGGSLTLDVAVTSLPQADQDLPPPWLVRARQAEADPTTDGAETAVLVADAAGRLVMADAALLAWVGADSEAQLLGQPVQQLLGDPHRQLAALLSDVRRQGMAVQPVATLGPAGSPLRVAMSASLLVDGDQERVALVLQRLDTTPRVVAPLDLMATLQRIAQRVGQLPLPALLREATEATERHAIDAALAAAGGRHDEAALQLGIEPAELRQRLQRLGRVPPP